MRVLLWVSAVVAAGIVLGFVGSSALVFVLLGVAVVFWLIGVWVQPFQGSRSAATVMLVGLGLLVFGTWLLIYREPMVGFGVAIAGALGLIGGYWQVWRSIRRARHEAK